MVGLAGEEAGKTLRERSRKLLSAAELVRWSSSGAPSFKRIRVESFSTTLDACSAVMGWGGACRDSSPFFSRNALSTCSGSTDGDNSVSARPCCANHSASSRSRFMRSNSSSWSRFGKRMRQIAWTMFAAYTCAAVLLRLSIVRCRADHCSRKRMMCGKSWSAARWSGVSPFRFALSTGAPAKRSISMMLLNPRITARCSGVSPPLVAASSSTSWRRRSRSWTMSGSGAQWLSGVRLPLVAQCIGVHPLSVTAFGSLASFRSSSWHARAFPFQIEWMSAVFPREVRRLRSMVAL
mmetsp:Transcript_14347/g.33792  ORF Transcript_14347/g.33792 Transcript_14347/m.33792 type:complete len:294 (+) Transcript_14347:1076-1957(+)